MKKRYPVILLLILALLLTSCSDLVKLTYEDGVYRDKAHGVDYTGAPVCYEPVSVGEPYAHYFIGSNKTEITLRRVGSLSPKEVLSESYEGVGALYVAGGFELPSLEEFRPTAVLICTEENITMHLQTIDNAAAISKILDRIENGEEVDLPLTGALSYRLKFRSDVYPDLYYSMLYVIDNDGNGYFYNRATKRAVEAGSSMTGFFDSYEAAENDAGGSAA